MKPQLFTLAEFASAPGGRLTIVNAFDLLNSSGFPVTASPMAVTTKIMAERKGECGKSYSGVIRIRKHRARTAVLEASVEFPLKEWRADLPPPSAVIGVTLTGVSFESPGMYDVDFLLDGEVFCGQKLRVQLAPQEGDVDAKKPKAKAKKRKAKAKKRTATK